MKGIGIKFCKLFIWYPDISECVSIDYNRLYCIPFAGNWVHPRYFSGVLLFVYCSVLYYLFCLFYSRVLCTQCCQCLGIVYS